MPELVIHDGHKCAYLDDRRIILTNLEYRTLLCLGEANGNVVGKDELVVALYPDAQGGVSDASIDQNISLLRKKLGDSARSYIITRRGMGYYLKNARVVYANKAQSKNQVVGKNMAPDPVQRPEAAAPPTTSIPASDKLRQFLLAKGLTRRERQIVMLLVDDKQMACSSNHELAQKLGRTTGTVKKHLQRIYRKLGVRRHSQAIQVTLQAMYDGGGIA